MKPYSIALLFVLFFAIACAAPTTKPSPHPSAPPDDAGVQLLKVADGFAQPLFATGAGDGTGRLFVAEHGGKIWILKDGKRLETPFLDISARITTNSLEYGILGLAFHPNYAKNQTFFVDYTVGEHGDTVVARFQASKTNPDVADPNSLQIVITQTQTTQYHRGGHLAFGPDGYLYIGMGDGGPEGDPQGHGQDLHTLLGKLLRIDVDSSAPYAVPPDNPFVKNPAARPEIWAYGLRNPWRFSFDRQTGDLYIGDVGQNAWEEVDFQPAGDKGGENYGWNAYEGNHAYGPTPAATTLTPPIVEYEHSQGVAVTGGYVYRGRALPALTGVYFYGDFARGTIWSLVRDAAGKWQNQVFLEKGGSSLCSFGEDDNGELYVVSYNGSIFRFAVAK